MSDSTNIPTFENDIMPMFYQFAAQMRWRFDLTSHEDVKNNAEMIYERISSKSGGAVMPPPPFSPLSKAQITAFKDWMDNGYP